MTLEEFVKHVGAFYAANIDKAHMPVKVYDEYRTFVPVAGIEFVGEGRENEDGTLDEHYKYHFINPGKFHTRLHF